MVVQFHHYGVVYGVCGDSAVCQFLDLATLSSICPDAVQYLMGQTNPAMFRVSTCWRHERDARARYGVVYGLCGDSTVCQFLVQAPRGTTVKADTITVASVQTQQAEDVYTPDGYIIIIIVIMMMMMLRMDDNDDDDDGGDDCRYYFNHRCF